MPSQPPSGSRPRWAAAGAVCATLLLLAVGAAGAGAAERTAVDFQLRRPARLVLTIATRHCESHWLVVRINGEIRARKAISGPRERVVTAALTPAQLRVSVTSPRCATALRLSSIQLARPVDIESTGSGPSAAPGPSAPPVAPSIPAAETSPPPAPAPVTEAAPAGRTIPIGTAVGTQFLRGGDPRYEQTLVANFQSITPENEMKWETIEPAPGTFNFAPAEEIVNFARAHGMSVRGHNLVWEQQLPGWLTSRSWSRPELEAVLHRHIAAEVGHFRGDVHEWDVVNEPFNNDGSLKSDLWSNVIGPEYIALALRWAHEADPTAALYINDYNVDWNGPKQQALLALLSRFKAEGVPVDGVGMEEHLSLTWAPTESQIEDSMRSYEALGLDVEVTEMDVGTREFTGNVEEAENEQAEVFGAAARACRAVDACQRFSVWGVSDAVSWLGTAEAGLPFNVNYEAKPAWLAIQENLANP